MTFTQKKNIITLLLRNYNLGTRVPTTQKKNADYENQH